LDAKIECFDGDRTPVVRLGEILEFDHLIRGPHDQTYISPSAWRRL
jgi:hypothetical protein